jgi:hypothetical protein
MTQAEAEIVAAVLAGVDGGECLVCATYAACEMQKMLPWFDWFELVAVASRRWEPDQLRAGSPCGNLKQLLDSSHVGSRSNRG